MFPSHSQACTFSKVRQQGGMLVIALFIIVVFSLLALALTRLLSASSENVVYEVLGARALNAARTGLEICLAREYPLNLSPPVVVAPCGNPETGDFAAYAGLQQGCSFSVSSLLDKNVVDGPDTYSYSRFVSTGRCEAGDVIVTRRILVDAIE
jgi:MSHA biogenesis protein MshP